MRRIIVVIFGLITLTGIASCKEENKVPDIKQMIKNLPSEYKKQKKINGMMRDTCFFWGWTGYGHPIQMINPTSYAETQKKQKNYYAYNEASLDASGSIPLFILVEKFIVQRQLIPLDGKQIGEGKAGDVYYLFHKQQNRVVLDKEVALDDTFQVREYIHITFDQAGKLIISELVKKAFEWSHEYEYDKNGLLMKIFTKRSDGQTFVQERGKDF